MAFRRDLKSHKNDGCRPFLGGSCLGFLLLLFFFSSPPPKFTFRSPYLSGAPTVAHFVLPLTLYTRSLRAALSRLPLVKQRAPALVINHAVSSAPAAGATVSSLCLGCTVMVRCRGFTVTCEGSHQAGCTLSTLPYRSGHSGSHHTFLCSPPHVWSLEEENRIGTCFQRPEEKKLKKKRGKKNCYLSTVMNSCVQLCHIFSSLVLCCACLPTAKQQTSV